MRKIDQLLTEYGESHQNVTNKTIHWICVPLIFFSIVGMIASIPSAALHSVYESPLANWAVIALVLVLMYYVSLSIPLSIGMTIFSFICLYGARWISHLGLAPLWVVCLIIVVLAWIGQFYGHSVEGMKPSFFKDLQFLLIGPAWLMHFIYKRLGISY